MGLRIESQNPDRGFSCPGSSAWHPWGSASLCDSLGTWTLRGTGRRHKSWTSIALLPTQLYLATIFDSGQSMFLWVEWGSSYKNPTRGVNDGARNKDSEAWSSSAQALRSGAVWSSSYWGLAGHLGDGSGPGYVGQFLCNLSNCLLLYFVPSLACFQNYYHSSSIVPAQSKSQLLKEINMPQGSLQQQRTY